MNTSTCNTGTFLKPLTTKLKCNFLIKKKKKGWEPKAAAFVFQPSPTERPDLSEAWGSANYPRIAGNHKLLKWELLLLPVKQLVSLPHSQRGNQGRAVRQGPSENVSSDRPRYTP